MQSYITNGFFILISTAFRIHLVGSLFFHRQFERFQFLLHYLHKFFLGELSHLNGTWQCLTSRKGKGSGFAASIVQFSRLPLLCWHPYQVTWWLFDFVLGIKTKLKVLSGGNSKQYISLGPVVFPLGSYVKISRIFT